MNGAVVPASTCLDCGHELMVPDRFCRQCGLPVPADQTGPAATAYEQGTTWGWGGPRTVLAAAVVLGAVLAAAAWQPVTVEIGGVTAAIGVDVLDPIGPIERTAGDGPILEGVEGRLLLSNHRHSTILDLGSGDAEVFETEGLVVAVVGRELLMVQSGFGNPRLERSIRLVPMDDPGGRGRALTEVDQAVVGAYYGQAIQAVYDDAVVVSSDYVVSRLHWRKPTNGGSVIVRFDDGAILDVARYPTSEPTYYPGAGSFVHTDDGFVKVADGAPISVGPSLALMETCQAWHECERYWLDYRRNERVERHVPESIGDGARPAITHIGRESVAVAQHLLTEDGRRRKQYFDTLRGRVVDVEEQGIGLVGRLDSAHSDLIGPRLAGEDVSSDGRYLAYPRFGGVGIVDLETNTEVAVVSESMPGSPLTVRYLPSSSRL